jgi:hypothetical protein
MIQSVRDITLRTLGKDVAALSKNQKPQAETLTMQSSQEVAAPVSESRDQDSPANEPKKSALPLTIGIIVLLALAGYFAYLLLS